MNIMKYYTVFGSATVLGSTTVLGSASVSVSQPSWLPKITSTSLKQLIPELCKSMNKYMKTYDSPFCESPKSS